MKFASFTWHVSHNFSFFILCIHSMMRWWQTWNHTFSWFHDAEKDLNSWYLTHLSGLPQKNFRNHCSEWWLCLKAQTGIQMWTWSWEAVRVGWLPAELKLNNCSSSPTRIPILLYPLFSMREVYFFTLSMLCLAMWLALANGMHMDMHTANMNRGFEWAYMVWPHFLHSSHLPWEAYPR